MELGEDGDANSNATRLRQRKKVIERQESKAVAITADEDIVKNLQVGSVFMTRFRQHSWRSDIQIEFEIDYSRNSSCPFLVAYREAVVSIIEIIAIIVLYIFPHQASLERRLQVRLNIFVMQVKILGDSWQYHTFMSLIVDAIGILAGLLRAGS